MNVQVVAAYKDSERSVGWVSLQPDGAVSVGLSDRTFVAPSFRARNFLWNVNNRVTLEYRVAHEPGAMEPVVNPHLTFHPPIYFHLRENNQVELWAGMADVAIMLEQDGIVRWVRFVSKPFTELKATGPLRDPSRTTIRKVSVPDTEHSIGLGVDFVRRPGEAPPEWVTKNLVGATAGVGIDIHTSILPPQTSTLAWLHHY